MITSIFAPTPCPCGRRHRLPLDVAGVVRWLCTVTRKVYTLRLHPEKFQRLLATAPSERAVHAEGLCVVHQAAAPDGFQQRCEDCGWLLVSYRARVSYGLVFRDELTFWPAGALVGRSIDGSYYLAAAPMSPHRERRCFTPAGVA